MKPCPPLSRYGFPFFLALTTLILVFIRPELGKDVAAFSLDSFLEMLSIIPPVFLLLGLMDVWIPKETMMKYLGKEAGVKGSVAALLLGSFSAGPLYASFPIAAVFLKKGVSLFNVFLFLGAWSTTKIPMMLFEITQLGVRFALTRFILNLIAIVVLAVFMVKTMDAGDIKALRDSAAKV